jgi:DNA repair exonuclease SbcCD ATPase subunit
LKSIQLENYRSHGDTFILDLNDKSGIFQIKGLNEQGKTNLLSSIMYLLYGKTLETKKKEKNGDLRFINNKTNKDYCKVSGVIEINGDEYQLERITERK